MLTHLPGLEELDEMDAEDPKHGRVGANSDLVSPREHPVDMMARA